MIFEEEEDKKLDDKDVLWKYLDFHKFIDLISNKTLHFTRLDQFDDPFEGACNELINERFCWKDTPEEHNMQHLGKDVARLLTNQSNSKMARYKKESEKSQKSQFVNCWNKLERESMAMWNLYSNSNSIAIKLDGRKFIDNLKMIIENKTELLPNHYFSVGSVFYGKINPPDLINSTIFPNRLNAFKKDVCFSHEEEYRLLICSPPSKKIDKNPKFHKIKLYDSFFDDIEIICHPKMEDWKFNNIECICKEFQIKPPPQKSKIELNSKL